MKFLKKCKQKKLSPAVYGAMIVIVISSGGNSHHDGLTGLGVGVLIGIMILSLLVIRNCKK